MQGTKDIHVCHPIIYFYWFYHRKITLNSEVNLQHTMTTVTLITLRSRQYRRCWTRFYLPVEDIVIGLDESTEAIVKVTGHVDGKQICNDTSRRVVMKYHYSINYFRDHDWSLYMTYILKFNTTAGIRIRNIYQQQQTVV